MSGEEDDPAVDPEEVGDPDAAGTEATRRPTTIDAGVAAGSAVLAAAAAAYGSLPAFGATLVGACLLVLGLLYGRRPAVDVAGLALFVGVLAAGFEGGSVEATLVGTVACVVAWDLGQCAIDLGEQLGREADTARLEAIHVASSVLIGVVTVSVGYALYVVAAGGQPAAALVLLLLAAALVTIGLGARRARSGRRSRGGRPY